MNETIKITDDIGTMLYYHNSNDQYEFIDIRCCIGDVEFSTINIFFKFENHVYVAEATWDLESAGHYDTFWFENDNDDGLIECKKVDENQEQYYLKLLELNHEYDVSFIHHR